MAQHYGLILAGGKGTRLWPLSRENYPKQFVEFKDGLSLFQLTVKRLLTHFKPEAVFTITQENYKFTIYNQLELCPGLSASARAALKKNVFCEPVGKNTLPAILLAMKYIEKARAFNADDILFVFPSDHVVEPVSAFTRCLKAAGRLSGQQKRIVVFGLVPLYPKEGFGYILVKDKLTDGYSVDTFVEKPDAKKAESLIARGAFWNAGIFCFRKDVFLEELSAFAPELFKDYNRSFEGFLKQFPSLKADSIDYRIMQKTRKAALIKFDVRWTDLGSWDSFLQFYNKGDGNLNIGQAEFIDSHNCFTYSKDRLVCMVGLKDIIAVDSNDSLLLVKRGSSDRVKELVAAINKRKLGHTKDSATVYRPWGYYTVLHEGSGYKVKEIGIFPKKSLSLQRHKFRSEHWNVVEGAVYVHVDGIQTQARKNQSVYVPRGKKHRIFNHATCTAKIIEVQIGPYLGEDDIVRYTKY